MHKNTNFDPCTAHGDAIAEVKNLIANNKMHIYPGMNTLHLDPDRVDHWLTAICVAHIIAATNGEMYRFGMAVAMLEHNVVSKKKVRNCIRSQAANFFLI